MTDANLATLRRPQRADARRNFDSVLAAARTVFAEQGIDASLEEIARRAGVGIGTLYRNFPTRQDLVEAIYVDEIEQLGRRAVELADLEPWESLALWLRQFVSYASTKKALAEGLNQDSELLRSCREIMYSAGGGLMDRAQAARVVRDDTSLDDVMRLVIGITNVGYTSDEQRERVLQMALDGIRPR
ncbi:MAG TPA: helix-turn-helix domain-containing protein [Galbitalea sp.]